MSSALSGIVTDGMGMTGQFLSDFAVFLAVPLGLALFVTVAWFLKGFFSK